VRSQPVFEHETIFMNDFDLSSEIGANFFASGALIEQEKNEVIGFVGIMIEESVELEAMLDRKVRRFVKHLGHKGALTVQMLGDFLSETVTSARMRLDPGIEIVPVVEIVIDFAQIASHNLLLKAYY
jgi:hypothetical protein